MLKKISAYFASFLLSFGSLLVIVPSVHAAADTCTWTGGGSDDNFSTAANWSGCDNGTLPENGDSLVYDNSSLSAALVVNNDLTSASFNTITFQGSGAWGVTIDGNAFTITGGITETADAFLDINAAVALSGNQTFTVTPAFAVMNIDGVLSGSGNLTKAGAGTMKISGNNSGYTGAITLSAGELLFNHINALGATSAGTTVATGAVLGFYGFSSDVTVAEPLTLSGNTTTGTITLAQTFGGGGGSVSPPYATATFSGAVTLQTNIVVKLYEKNLKLTGACSGNFSLAVESGATGSLNVASSPNSCLTSGIQETAAKTTEYKDNSPATSITISNKETAIVTGTYGTVSVGFGGTLKGTGTVGTLSVDNGGKLAPGLSPGCINSGNLTFISGSTYEFEVGGITACTEYDQTKVTGTVDLGNGTLNTILFNNFKPVAGQSYMIIENDVADAVSGTFNGLAEGATFTVSGYVLKISYVGGTGNDVVLTVQSVPATPNTGFQLLTRSPIAALLASTAMAGCILIIARKYAKVTVRK